MRAWRRERMGACLQWPPCAAAACRPLPRPRPAACPRPRQAAVPCCGAAHGVLNYWQHCQRVCASCPTPSTQLSQQLTDRTAALPPCYARPPPLPLPQSSAAMSRLESMRAPAVDPQQARLDAEEARRGKLYSIMACIREVQKRNDRTGAPLLACRCLGFWWGLVAASSTQDGKSRGRRPASSLPLCSWGRRHLTITYICQFCPARARPALPCPALQRRCSSLWRTQWPCWPALATSQRRSWCSSWRMAPASGASCSRRCSGTPTFLLQCLALPVHTGWHCPCQTKCT